MIKNQISSQKRAETLLHNKIKALYVTNENVKSEVYQKINTKNFRFDVFDDEKSMIYEIQRSSLGGRFSQKIQTLLDSTNYQIRIIHPIVHKQKVTRLDGDNKISTSYRNFYTHVYHFFEHLVHFKVSYQERLQFDILLVYEHLFKQFSGYYQRTGRRRFYTSDRDLVSIDHVKKIRCKEDFYTFLPIDLPTHFTNQDLFNSFTFKRKSRRNSRLPGKITYSLCQLGLLERVGKKRNAHVFSRRD